MWVCTNDQSIHSDNEKYCCFCGQKRNDQFCEETKNDAKSSKSKHIGILIITVTLIAAAIILGFFLSNNRLYGYYLSENGKYSLSINKDGSCSWYQDGIRFDGNYEKDDQNLTLYLEGRSHYSNTTFSAAIGKRTLRVNGGTVDNELFAKQKKPDEIKSLDSIDYSIWKTEVKEYYKNGEYEIIGDYLRTYSDIDDQARVLRAFFLSMEETQEEDYRDAVAEIINDGIDMKTELDNISKELFNVCYTLDYDSMALNTYCIGNYSTSSTLARYQAKRGDFFGRDLFIFGVLYNYAFYEAASEKEEISLDEIEEWIDSNIQAGDPISMYLKAEMSTYTGAEEDMDYFHKAAYLLSEIAQGGSITVKGEENNEDDEDNINDGFMSLLSVGGYTTSNPLISFYIGECYRFGDGTFPQDLDQAKPWYKQAAERGLPEARQNYSHLLLWQLLNDEVTEEEYDNTVDECYFYLAWAANNCSLPRAQYDYAIFYYCNDDTENGKLWMERAAESGFKTAIDCIESDSVIVRNWM